MDSTYLPTFETGKQKLERIRSLVPTKPLQTEQEYQALGAAMIEAKEFHVWWDEFMRPVINDAHAQHKKTIAKFKELDDPVMQALDQMKPYHMEFRNREEIRRAAEEAKRTAELAAMTPPEQNVLPIAVTLPKLTAQDGISTRSTWRAEVKDLKALIKAVASGKLPTTYLIPNMVALNQQAKALKGELNTPQRIAGVVAVEETDLAIRVK